MIINPYVFATAPATSDIIQLLGDGVDGGSVFTDGGTAGSVWTRSGSDIQTKTAYAVQGTASIHCGSASQYLGTTYVSANAITTGDFFIGFWMQTGNVSSYVMGVSGVTSTPAERAWLVYRNGPGNIFLFISDGTTTSNVNFGNPTGSHYVRIERVGSTIYCSLDTAAPTTLAFSAAVNLPSGSPELRLCALPDGAGRAAEYIDMLQIRRSNVYAGAAIGSLPTTPIP